jgi:hypothetical protein
MVSLPVIVSAYYKIPSKQPHTFYMPHLMRWFNGIRTQPVVFFTTADMEAEIRGWGLPLANVRFVAQPFEELTALQKYGRDFWDRQKARDPEAYHTPEVAILWHEKKYFVQRAAALCPEANVFIWTDAGCVRDPRTASFLAEFGRRTTINLDDGRIHLQQIRQIPRKEFYRFPDTSIAGAILAGNRTAWGLHIALSETVLDLYDTAGISANSDQYVTLTCVGAQPDLYALHTRPRALMVNEWFFFLSYL